MQITIPTKSLSELLGKVKAVASGRASLPCLNCVRLSAKGEDLTVSACDLDLQAQVTAACKVEKAGEVAVSFHRLFSAVSAIATGEVSISSDAKNGVALSRGSASLKLHGVDVAELPALPFTKAEDSLRVPQEQLGRILRQVGAFASDDPTRPVLCGVGIGPCDQGTYFCATDGRTLRAEWISDKTKNGVVLPSSAVALIASLCGETEIAVELEFAENLFLARSSEWCVTGKLVEGQFPNWKQVIPKKSVNGVTFNVDEMVRALGVASVTAPEPPNVKLEPEKGALWLASEEKDKGSTREEVTGAECSLKAKCAFNPIYLRRMVKSFSADTLTLQMEDGISPGFIEEGNGLSVLIPVRVS